VKLLALACGILLALAASASASTNAKRAAATYKALQRYYYVPQYEVYKGDPYAYTWPSSQALAATVALADVDRRYSKDVGDRVQGLEHYFDDSAAPPGYDGQARSPLGRGGDKYYDDNEWIGLALLRRWQETRSPPLLARAETTFRLAQTGWDPDQEHPCPGGVFFNNSPKNTDRNTVTNAPGALLGAELYAATGNLDDLLWSIQMYEWVRNCLAGPDGLYLDHISFDGRIDETTWSYNQGTMIGAGVVLYRVTGDKTYLTQAKQLADAALRRFSGGRLLTADRPFFLAIYFENLLLLDATRHDKRYRAAMQAFANAAWKKIRTSSTGLFAFPQERNVEVLNQAAMIRIFADLARNPADFKKPS
jgi:glycosyl hydrolase family 76